ncbi:unnamed protein product, partial [Polarella glacialis]
MTFTEIGGHARSVGFLRVFLLACATACALVSGEATAPDEAPEFPAWLPRVELEDYECRRPFGQATVVDWGALREHFGELVQGSLDERSMEPLADSEWRRGVQLELVKLSALVLLRFPQALAECPLG